MTLSTTPPISRGHLNRVKGSDAAMHAKAKMSALATRVVIIIIFNTEWFHNTRSRSFWQLQSQCEHYFMAS